MPDTLDESLQRSKRIKNRNRRRSALLLILSLAVTLDVFWTLRQPGLTLAGDACCGKLEHTHDDSCFQQMCICSISEEPHVHDDSCYEITLVEAQEELRQICEKTEAPHEHTDGCYETVFVEPVEEKSLVCENEDPEHVHEDGCYETTITEGYEEQVLTCTLTAEPHVHTENCYAVEIIEAYEERSLICDLSEAAHIHEESCYNSEMQCGIEEHIHSIECYADKTADVETQLDWQSMFGSYPHTGNLRKDLVGIAQMQVGYAESELNFEVDEDGDRHGYTRYGAWYGAPYGDWSAMFVSFCLHYAGAEPGEAPGNTGANSMANSWKRLDKFASVGDYVPSSGDLVFFKNNTVGIVAEVNSTTVYVICGDVNDAVVGAVMSMGDRSISGWGTTVGTVPDLEEPPEEEPP